MEIRPENSRPIVSMAIAESTGALAVGQHGDEIGNANLTIWDVRTGRLQQVVEAAREDNVSAVTFSSTGRLFYCTRDRGLIARDLGSATGVVADWDVRDVRYAEVHPDGLSILTCGERTDLWDLRDDRRTWTLPDYRAGEITDADVFTGTCWVGHEQASTGYENYPALGTFSRDGNRLFVAGNNLDRVTELDPRSGEPGRTFPCSPLQVASVSECSEWAVAGVVGRVPTGVFVWETSGGEPILNHVFNRTYTNTSCIAFSLSRKVAIVGTTIGYLNVHTLDDGRMLSSSRLHRGAIRCLVVYEDGEVVVSGGDDGRVVISKLGSLL